MDQIKISNTVSLNLLGSLKSMGAPWSNPKTLIILLHLQTNWIFCKSVYYYYYVYELTNLRSDKWWNRKMSKINI